MKIFTFGLLYIKNKVFLYELMQLLSYNFFPSNFNCFFWLLYEYMWVYMYTRTTKKITFESARINFGIH